jgi:hypothetical protein
MSRLTQLVFPRRIGRMNFIPRVVLLIVATQFFYESVRFSARPWPAFAWSLGAGFLTAYSLLFVFLPRLRDAGMSDWWLIVALFPLLNLPLALLLAFQEPRHSSVRRT